MAKTKNTKNVVNDNVNTIGKATIYFSNDVILEVTYNEATKELNAKVGELSGTVTLSGGN